MEENRLSIASALHHIFHSQYTKRSFKEVSTKQCKTDLATGTEPQLVRALQCIQSHWELQCYPGGSKLDAGVIRYVCNQAANARSSKELKLCVEFIVWALGCAPINTLHEFSTLLNENYEHEHFTVHTVELLTRGVKRVFDAQNETDNHSTEFLAPLRGLVSTIPCCLEPLLIHVQTPDNVGATRCFIVLVTTFACIMRQICILKREPEQEDTQSKFEQLPEGVLADQVSKHTVSFLEKIKSRYESIEERAMFVIALDDLIHHIHSLMSTIQAVSGKDCLTGIRTVDVRTLLSIIQDSLPLCMVGQEPLGNQEGRSSFVLEWIRQESSLVAEHLQCDNEMDKRILGIVARIPIRCILLSLGGMGSEKEQILFIQEQPQRLLGQCIQSLKFSHPYTVNLAAHLFQSVSRVLFPKTSSGGSESQSMVERFLPILLRTVDQTSDRATFVIAELVSDFAELFPKIVLPRVLQEMKENHDGAIWQVLFHLTERCSFSWMREHSETHKTANLAILADYLYSSNIQWIGLQSHAMKSYLVRTFATFDPRIVVPELCSLAFTQSTSITERSNAEKCLIGVLKAPFEGPCDPVGASPAKDGRQMQTLRNGCFGASTLSPSQIANWQQVTLESFLQVVVSPSHIVSQFQKSAVRKPSDVSCALPGSGSSLESAKEFKHQLPRIAKNLVKEMPMSSWQIVLPQLLLKYWSNSASSEVVQVLRVWAEIISLNFEKIILPITLERMVQVQLLTPEHFEQHNVFLILAPLLILKMVSPEAFKRAAHQTPLHFRVMLRELVAIMAQDSQSKEIRKVTVEIISKCSNISIKDLGPSDSYLDSKTEVEQSCPLPLCFVSWILTAFTEQHVEDNIPQLFQALGNAPSSKVELTAYYLENELSRMRTESVDEFWTGSFYAPKSIEAAKVALFMLFQYLLLVRQSHDQCDCHLDSECSLRLPGSMVHMIVYIIMEMPVSPGVSSPLEVANLHRGCCDCIALLLGGCVLQHHMADTWLAAQRDVPPALATKVCSSPPATLEASWCYPKDLLQLVVTTACEGEYLSRKSSMQVRVHMCSLLVLLMRSAAQQSNLEGDVAESPVEAHSIVQGAAGLASSTVMKLSEGLSRCIKKVKLGEEEESVVLWQHALLQLLFTMYHVGNLAVNDVRAHPKASAKVSTALLPILQLKSVLQLVLDILAHHSSSSKGELGVGALKVLGAILSSPGEVLQGIMHDDLVERIRTELRKVHHVGPTPQVRALAQQLAYIFG